MFGKILPQIYIFEDFDIEKFADKTANLFVDYTEAFDFCVDDNLFDVGAAHRKTFDALIFYGAGKNIKRFTRKVYLLEISKNLKRKTPSTGEGFLHYRMFKVFEYSCFFEGDKHVISLKRVYISMI